MKKNIKVDKQIIELANVSEITLGDWGIASEGTKPYPKLVYKNNSSYEKYIISYINIFKQ